MRAIVLYDAEFLMSVGPSLVVHNLSTSRESQRVALAPPQVCDDIPRRSQGDYLRADQGDRNNEKQTSKDTKPRRDKQLYIYIYI